MMKKIILLVAFFAIAIAGYCAPFGFNFNYQAVVRNGSGALVPNGSSVSFRFSILDGSAAGPVSYSETQTVVLNNSQGLVSLQVGNGVATVGSSIGAANFSTGGDKFLQVEVDPAGGSSYTNMGSTKIQGVPYASYAHYSKYAENGTQWVTTGSDISYIGGKVNVGTSSPTGNGILSVEKNTSTNNILTVRQTGATGTGTTGAIYAYNASATLGAGIVGVQNGYGWGVIGTTIGSGIGVEGNSEGTYGFGVYGRGATGVSARTTTTNGIAIDLDGFIKVNGTKTAFQTSPLVSSAPIVTLSYGGAAITDMIFVTPISTAYVMPAWQVFWNTSTSVWEIFTASDDGSPSNFPAGTKFNILVIKQ